MITILKSQTADTRSCDYARVTKDQLEHSSKSHIKDVQDGLNFFAEMLGTAGSTHDQDKLTDLAGFYRDFKTGFKSTDWWDNHRQISRHHLLAEDGVPVDVNLVDVLEMIVDCVMAGMARTGTVYPLEIKPEVLQQAFDNTVTLLKANVEVVDR